MGTGSAAEDARIVVAVLTFRRNDLLRELLPELARQASQVQPHAGVIVVDNDPQGSAHDVVAGLDLAAVSYVHEPRPGIAAARNTALAAAEGADYIVFIDDDERPNPGWLASLVAAQARHDGAGIAGPVVRTYASEPAPWVRAARVFDRYRLPTGTVVEAASSANLLLDLDFVNSHGLRFDDHLGLSGGSDYLFTRQMTASGGRIHWCDEAVVTDPVPASRLTGRWTLQRGYRSGNSRAVVSLMLAPNRATRIKVRLNMLAGGMARVAGGSARSAIGLVSGDSTHRGRGAWTLVRGAGMVGGALGHQYVEYRR